MTSWSAPAEAGSSLARRSRSGHDRPRRESNAPGTRSICDALLAPEPGLLTFAINRQLLAGGLAVSDEDVRAAIAYAARTLKLVVEPGGAVALAAVMTGRIEARGRTIAVVVSGGNIDDALLREVLS